MLTQDQAQKYAIAEQTSTDNILKEHYQMYILDILYNSPFGNSLSFKGGTALRLVYKSIRFSEDLDFSILNEIDFSEFRKTIEKIPSVIPKSKIKEVYDKKYTLFAKLVFNIDFKPIPIGVKIEVNKEKKQFDHEIKLVESSFNNLEVLGSVYTLNQIFKDKLKCLKERREPRDLFDAWYVSQRIGVAFTISDNDKYSKRELMDNLNPFIPEKHRKVLQLFEKHEKR